jgi:arylsulfatase A-like enzyme
VVAPTEPNGPNVVLVVLDTARADAVGTTRDSAFSQLARRGRRFHRAVAPAPWTLPSHASIFSGLLPSEHGVTGEAVLTPGGLRTPKPRVDALGDRWLPEKLRRKGYATFAATGNPWVGPAVGLTMGFDRVVEAWRDAPLPKLSDPLAGSRTSSKLRAASVYARRALGLGDGGAASSLDAFGGFLREGGGRPFFAFFNVMEPHAPYAPPHGHGNVRLRRRPAAMAAVRRWNADRMLRYCLGREEIGDGELALLWALYRGEISYTEAWLARSLEILDDRGLLDDTLVIVTADHGENLGEHHLLSHVMSMHETLLHVPLAIAGPEVPAGEEHDPVGLTAIPSIVGSVIDGGWMDPASLAVVAEYESAAAQVSGAKRLDEQVADLGEDLERRLRERWTAAYEGRFKLVSSTAGEDALRDLVADPAEERDVASEHPEVVARLRAAAVSGREANAPDELAPALDAEITSHLEGLGYL